MSLGTIGYRFNSVNWFYASREVSLLASKAISRQVVEAKSLILVALEEVSRDISLLA